MRWIAVSLVSLLCACGARHADPSVAQASPASPSKLPDGAPLVTPGEHMAYRLALGGMELASYDFAIGELTDVAGKRAIVVQSHAKTVGLAKLAANVDDMFTSWIDVSTGRPLLWSVDEYAVKGTNRERTEAHLAERTGNVVPIDFHINDNAPRSEPQTVSMADVWDFNAFLVALRAWEAPEHARIEAEVLRSRFLWHVTMTVGPKETLVTELGDMPALRLDGHTYKLTRDGTRHPDSDARDFSIWISDDAGRVPLKTVARTDYGDIEMTILEYSPGTGPRLR